MIKRNIAYIGFLGNALEFYEFTIYAIFVKQFAEFFFPLKEEWISIMASWSIFGAAFFMRPVGAIIFGYIGDKFGRKVALSCSILLMAIATLMIGILPQYSDIGITAPMLLLLLRLLQGLSTGGEYNGTAIYLIEHFGKNNPGLISGIVTSSCVVGALAGTFVGKIYNDYHIPFIIGGILGLLLFTLRSFLMETIEFQSAEKSSKLNFKEYIKANPLTILANIWLGIVNGSLSYILFGFSLMYLQRYVHLPANSAFIINIIGLFSFMIFSPFCGKLFDHFGSINYYRAMLISLIILALPVNFALQSANFYISIISIILIGFLTAAIAGPSHAYLQENIPVLFRYRIVASSFSIGMAIGGGITPSTLILLIEKYQLLLSPALCLIFLSFIFLLIIWLRMRAISKSHPHIQTLLYH
jgi:MHS family proline/betaine transporter-like MFS transporter